MIRFGVFGKAIGRLDHLNGLKCVLVGGDSNDEDMVEVVEIHVVSGLSVFMVWFGTSEHTGVHIPVTSGTNLGSCSAHC